MTRRQADPTAEGYMNGLQGLPWALPESPRPPGEDGAACFLFDIRARAVPLRGRIKRGRLPYLEAFRLGLEETFGEARNKPFFSAVQKLWVRWLSAVSPAGDPAEFSRETGRRVGCLLKREYEEGIAGSLAPFLLDKRIHLEGVHGFLCMRGWLAGRIEYLRRRPEPAARECAGILDANFASILLRAQHNLGPGYAAAAAGKLSSLVKDLDGAIENLSRTEPEAARYLRSNRATVITRALHSGLLGYGNQAAERLPSALRELDRRIESLSSSSPQEAERLLAKKHRVVYRALSNGRLKMP